MGVSNSKLLMFFRQVLRSRTIIAHSPLKSNQVHFFRNFASMSTNPSKYKFNHSMLRVKDPKRSLEFYQNALGMKLINNIKNPDAKFDLYFLAYDGPKAVSSGNHWTDREGIVELTHNYGTEDDANYQVNNGNADPHKGFGHIAVSVDNIQAACKRLEDQGWSFQKNEKDFKYHNGNDEPQGFGHICVTVDDIDAACKRFEDHKVSWKKRLTDGRMKNIAFVLDPDGYWIEVVQNESIKKTTDW